MIPSAVVAVVVVVVVVVEVAELVEKAWGYLMGRGMGYVWPIVRPPLGHLGPPLGYRWSNITPTS